MKRTLLLMFIGLFCAGLCCAGALPALEEKVENGLYKVLRISETRETVLPLKDDEILVESSPLFHEPGEKTRYVVLAKKPHVPLALREKPVKVKDPTERTKSWIQVRLTEKAARELEAFSKANIGNSGTMVIGGKSLTVHTIRTVLSDGRLQISR